MADFFDIVPHLPLINNPDYVYPREVIVPAYHAEAEGSEAQVESFSIFKNSVRAVIIGIMTANYPNLSFESQRIWAAETMKDRNAYTLDIKPLTGGISNVLYLVRRIDSITSSVESIIIRLYGTGTSKIIDRRTENIVFAKLSSVRYGPTFYGRFENGRIEGYLEGCRSLSPLCMKSPTIAPLIAMALVRLHTFEIEEVHHLNEPGEAGLWKKLFLFVNCAKESASVNTLENELNHVESEIKWLHDCLTRKHVSSTSSSGCGSSNEGVEEGDGGMLFGCEVVLCHNDLLCGNILLCPSEEASASQAPAEKAVLIDYEYSMYNYRAFDIANHFCECCGFEFDWSDFPNQAERRLFLRTYINTYLTIELKTKYPNMQSEEFLTSFENCVLLFTLASHLFWASWSLYQALVSQIDFDYKGYAKLRIAAYSLNKEEFRSLISKIFP